MGYGESAGTFWINIGTEENPEWAYWGQRK